MAIIERDVLRHLINDWANGFVTLEEVHEQAEEYCEEYDRPELDEDDPNSIPVEVLSQLEILNHQLITPGDVPAIQRFLDATPGSEREAWVAWRSYWNKIDYEARKSELKEIEYYVT